MRWWDISCENMQWKIWDEVKMNEKKSERRIRVVDDDDD